MRIFIPLLFAIGALASPMPVSADLRSFFHGEPAAPPKAAPPKQLAAVSTAPGVTADAQIESFLRALADALKAREGEPMLARLSDRFSIDDLPDGIKPGKLFVQAVASTPSPTDIVVRSVEKQGNVRNARVELRFGPDKVKQKTFRFDADGKLLWTDWFQIKVQRGDS